MELSDRAKAFWFFVLIAVLVAGIVSYGKRLDREKEPRPIPTVSITNVR